MTGGGTGGGVAIPEPIPDEPPLDGELAYDALEPGEVVGHGGNATVTAASLRDDPGRVVALKEPHLAGDVPEAVAERFGAEAETWATLDDHAHVVTVHGWGTDPHPWIALEYVRGGNLADLVGEGDVDRGLWIGSRVASALAHAHGAGVAHLDLTPANVLLRETPGGAWPAPAVADWGMARFLRAGAVNLEGLSPRYAAPEQFAPDRYGQAGAATDVYQLGVVLYELLVGTPPFDGPPRALRDAVLAEPPPVPSGRNPRLPAAVDDLLDRALAKAPGDRYDSMAAVERALEGLLAERTAYVPDRVDGPPADGRGGEGAAVHSEADAGDAVAVGDDGDAAVRAAVSMPGEEASGRDRSSPYDRALVLADEGFVQLSERYFARRDPAPPPAAWRRGVTLADARAGRAVERTVPDDERGERTELAERVFEAASAGADQVVLGPPGSGKSTVCKQVACEWFDRGLGPVLYRESGADERFERPDALARRVTAGGGRVTGDGERVTDGDDRDADGRALVVVEDAVRPEASAVFEFLDRVADDESATVLLDAREGEWREAGRGPDSLESDPVRAGRESLDPVYVPRPDAGEQERFVRAVEAATGRSVPVDVDQLREDVELAAAGGSDGVGDGTRPGELFYLLHRLTALAGDPLADDGGATTLTDGVEDVSGRLADAGDAATDVGVCANLLNAAGLGVHPELLHAAVPDDPLAVDDAVDVLAGRVLFPREADWSDGTTAYPATHEAWSTEFLAHRLAAGDEAVARERFGRVLGGVLSLADDPGLREQVAGALEGDAPELARVETDPESWADEAVERVVGLAGRYPRLAPLFGTVESATYDLPDACPGSRLRSAVLTRGDAHREHGAYDAATAEYEAALERARRADDAARVAASLERLGTAARQQNDYDRARERYERSLEVAREVGDPRLEAAVLAQLGRNATSRSEYDRGREFLERGLEAARELGDRGGVARCLYHLGTVAMRQSDNEEALEYYRRSLDIRRELGERRGVAESLNGLGGTEYLLGDYEAAREHYGRSLEIQRDVGRRPGVSKVLHNLGLVAYKQRDDERAREYHRRAIEIDRELDVPDGIALNANKLGRVAERRGDHETAREHHRRALEIWRDLDDRHGVARGHRDLGSTLLGLDDHETAREHLDRALETYRDVGDDDGRAECLRTLGTLARRRGDVDAARRRYEAARETFGETGSVHSEVEVLADLAGLERDAGHPDRAREHCALARRRLDEADLPDDVREEVESRCEAVGDGDPA